MLPGALGWGHGLLRRPGEFATLPHARPNSRHGHAGSEYASPGGGRRRVACGFLILIVARPFLPAHDTSCAPPRYAAHSRPSQPAKDLPIVICENGNDYEEAVFNSPQPTARYYFVIDEPQALNTDNAPISRCLSAASRKPCKGSTPNPRPWQWDSPAMAVSSCKGQSRAFLVFSIAPASPGRRIG